MSDFSGDRYQRPIRQLDRVLINKIAAGEVIERPASVVKELVENSFDAGARSVVITARKAGTTSITVVDDGSGIRSDQLELAFSRHATSKIENLDDLFSVMSYGFRGEALPSIASVAHLKLTTRHHSEASGTYMVYEGGKKIESKPVSAPVGTSIEVSHLFYNTPARRKFLKTETTEARHIVRVAERMALSKPAVAASLTLNDRQVFNLPPDQPLAERMASLFGIQAGEIVEYDVEMSGVSYLAYLAHPSQARQTRDRICLFINGRSVTSQTIIHAVTSGYGEFLPGRHYPLACVYLTVDPGQIDVNVHPTKAEVRLSEERAIHDNLYRIVKKALRDWKMVPSEGYGAGGGYGDRRKQTGAGDSAGYKASQIPPSRPQTFFTGEGREGSLSRPPGSSERASFERPLSRQETEAAADFACENIRPAEDTIPSQAPVVEAVGREDIVYLGKFSRTYLLVTIRGELYIVDQHAAHERILYEDALRQVEEGSASGQKLLFPETIELSAEEYLCFEESAESLARLGFEIEPFGQHTVIINATPVVFKERNPAVIVRSLLDDILQLNKAGGDFIKSVAQSLACRAAVMAGDRLTEEEAITLILALFAKNNPYCCPHGRPTFIKISREELDHRFDRT